MSLVYFTTQHEGTAELRGSERAWMGLLCRDLAASVVPDRLEELEPRLAPASPLRRWLREDRLQALPRWIRTYLHAVTDDPVFIDHDGTALETFDLVLNTALALGSDPVALMARLHAQCEIHCYVEGHDRTWMADVIDAGLRDGVMRDGKGWDSVTTLLRSGDIWNPVVCHYSVTDGFPNHGITDWSPADPDDENAWDAWYDLPADEQWGLALAALRSNPARRLDLSPDSLRARFGHRRSMLDLFAQPHRARAATTR